MLQFSIFTLFPGLFGPFLEEGILGKAQKTGLVQVRLINYRDHGLGKHKKVDDTPFGGGAGMVLRPEPIVEAIRQEEKDLGKRLRRILITPQGQRLNQKMAQELAQETSPLGLIAGRYEGFDERIRDYVDEEISLGDFVLLGGEVPIMALIEAVSRLVPEVIGNQESLADESFNAGLLEYPQYTKPLVFEGKEVPPILTSGHHQKISDWRRQQAEEKTRLRRPDLYRLFEKPKA